MLPQFLMNGLASGCVASLFAVAAWLLYRTCRFVDVSLAGIYVLCGYAFFAGCQAHLPAPLAILASSGLGVLLAAGSHLALFGPLQRRGASVPILLATSIALYEIYVNLCSVTYGNTTRVLDTAVTLAWQFGPLRLAHAQAVQVAVAVLACTLWICVSLRTQLGLFLRAAAEEPALVGSYGVNLAALRTTAFCLSGALVALAACLSASDVGMNPDRGMPALLDGLTAALLGGSGHVTGPIAGALLLGITQGLLSWQFSERWEHAAAPLLLMVLLLARPAGLRTSLTRTA